MRGESGEFIVQASALYADALTHDQLDPSKLVSLYAVKAQLSLFASQPSIDRAEEALQLIGDTYYQPNADFTSREALGTRRRDFLLAFTQASRRDLLV